MPIELTIAEGMGRGRRFRFDAAEVTIGRDPGSDLLVIDPGVSRSHARIRSEGAAHVLLDAGSSNGTALNGAPIHGTAPLAPGDRIGVGPLVFEFGPRRIAARWGVLPRWARTCALAGAGSCLLATVVWSVHWSAAPASRLPEAAVPQVRNAAKTSGETGRAQDLYERGRRKLEERRVAPRNLYDAWKSFTGARQLLEGRTPPPGLEALPRLIAEAEGDLMSECKKLLFTARRFEKYGVEQRAQAVYREVLLHFPGDDPSRCRAEARQELSDPAEVDGSGP